MKSVLFASLIFFAFDLYGQTATTTTAPKGTNLLIVHGTSYKKCLQVTLDEGLQIDKKDDSLFYFYTVAVQRKKGYTDTHIFYVRVKGDSAMVSGTWDSHMGANSGMFTIQSAAEPIMVKGWRTGGYIPNFILMDEFAHKLGDSVSYAIK